MPKTTSRNRTAPAPTPTAERNQSPRSRRDAASDVDLVGIRRKGVDTVTGIDGLDDEPPARSRPGSDHPHHRAAEVADIAGTPEHRHDLRGLTRNAVVAPERRAKPRRKKAAARTRAPGSAAGKKRPAAKPSATKRPTAKRAAPKRPAAKAKRARGSTKR